MVDSGNIASESKILTFLHFFEFKLVNRLVYLYNSLILRLYYTPWGSTKKQFRNELLFLLCYRNLNSCCLMEL